MTAKPAVGRSNLLGNVWFALLCLAVFCAPWMGGQMGGIGPAVARALTAAAGLAWVADRWGEWRVPRPAVWLWVFIAWSAVTTARSVYLHSSLLALSDLVSYVTLATLAAEAAGDLKRMRWLVWTALASLLVVAALGVQDGLTNVPGWRVFGPFATPNLFAAFLISVVPMGILIGATDWPSRLAEPSDAKSERPWPVNNNPVAKLAYFAGISALFFTGSKGAILSLLPALAFFIFLPVRKRIRWADASTLAVITFTAFTTTGHTLLGRAAAATSTDVHSSQFRVLTWKGAVVMAAAHPVLGTGVGTFGAAFNRYAIAGWTAAAHNAYLQTAAETGGVGLVLFLAALGSAALGLWRVGKPSPPAPLPGGEGSRLSDHVEFDMDAVALPPPSSPPSGRGDVVDSMPDPSLSINRLPSPPGRGAGGEGSSVLAAAALAGLVAAGAHNLVDYGWAVWGPSAVLWALVGLGLGRSGSVRVPRVLGALMILPLLGTLAGGLLVANASAVSDSAEAGEGQRSAADTARAYADARRYDPLDERLLTSQGRALRGAEDLSGAAAVYEQATRLSPYDPVAWRNLGEIQQALGNADAARRSFDAGLAHSPGSVKILADAARLAETQGRHADSLAFYRKLIAVAEGPAGQFPAIPEVVDPEPLEAYAAVASDELAHGDRDAARRHLESLVALAERYQKNLAAYPLQWKAVGLDDPAGLARVQEQEGDARKMLARLK